MLRPVSSAIVPSSSVLQHLDNKCFIDSAGRDGLVGFKTASLSCISYSQDHGLQLKHPLRRLFPTFHFYPPAFFSLAPNERPGKEGRKDGILPTPSVKRVRRRERERETQRKTDLVVGWGEPEEARERDSGNPVPFSALSIPNGSGGLDHFMSGRCPPVPGGDLLLSAETRGLQSQGQRVQCENGLNWSIAPGPGRGNKSWPVPSQTQCSLFRPAEHLSRNTSAVFPTPSEF